MAVYNLTGAGVHALTPSTQRLFIEILTYPATTRAGRAIPTNYYDVGLLRVGIQGAYGPSIPIDASTMFLDLPDGATSIGYSLFETVAIQVSEGGQPSGAGTFGYNQIGLAGNDNLAQNVVWVKAVTHPQFSGTVDHINVYCAPTGDTPPLAVALYDDNAGLPGTLLAQNATGLAPPSGYAWLSVPLSVAVTAGQQYWFGLVQSDDSMPDSILVAYDSSVTAQELYYHAYGPTFPADGSSAVFAAYERWSVYADYA
jgi:hypothetical protein